MPKPSASCRGGWRTRGRALDGAAALLVAALATGCATVADPYAVAPADAQLAADGELGDCLRRLQAFDARVDEAGVRDAQNVRVPGYPYLRADRYTAARMPQGADAQALTSARIERMAALDAEARSYEAANARVPAEQTAALQRCRAQLLAAATTDASRVATAAKVPDAYDDSMRTLGLYPMARVPFSWGVGAYQQATRELYATPFPEIPVRGQRIRYVPAASAVSADAVAGLLSSDARTAAALAMPALSPAAAWALLQQHAPVLVVDTVDDNDRIGRLAWRLSGDQLYVAAQVAEPGAYVRVAWTEFSGAAALQLVYTFWFPARPAAAPFDPQAGRLDGLMWRVTLDAAGRPLVYDSIHPCGCYHLFFPTENVRERPRPIAGEGSLDETMFAPQVVHSPGKRERMLVFVSSGDHQIQRVAVDQPQPAPGVPYALADENALRALPLPAAAGGGTRSIFGPDGLVPGTERSERFLYWPMGIPSAGQMRQWGHHATAFVGRRHFDDPHLLDRYFTLAPGLD